MDTLLDQTKNGVSLSTQTIKTDLSALINGSLSGSENNQGNQHWDLDATIPTPTPTPLPDDDTPVETPTPEEPSQPDTPATPAPTPEPDPVVPEPEVPAETQPDTSAEADYSTDTQAMDESGRVVHGQPDLSIDINHNGSGSLDASAVAGADGSLLADHPQYCGGFRPHHRRQE